MNFWVELDNWTVAQLVRALHRSRRAVGSIPARGPIVAFVLCLKKCINLPLSVQFNIDTQYDVIMWEEQRSGSRGEWLTFLFSHIMTSFI